MFIISLSYQVPLENVDALISDHVDNLNEQYLKGYFVLSGRKEPRTGGLIISTLNDRDKLNEVLQQDPFYKEKIASYDVTEFVPTKASEALTFLI